ncbi:hypothetical protein [Mycobacteroides abscessus]|uniref:hypothetical protein n=2 Tax=Mycobacteroides abscessus TaxID=36809 RepID=UPI0009A778E0|nr:hypothetical protein [Mycobacteroides abscessus]SLC71754.1 Uncharacterised protein [Mycobacteroides abscessus subsp. massiliense]SLJ49388.1 Uncharacterised protein [Mycobacteroides abscessus subsp. abscessus]
MKLFKTRKRADPAAPDSKVFYSTPFGDTNDGQKRVFLLERDGVQYFPVFRSAESMSEFYKRTNRAAYMILEGTLQRVIDTTRSIELMKDVRIVIEPLGEHPVEVDI